jgi:hypothetical protein
MTAVEFQTEKIGILVSKLFNDEISKAEFHFKRFEIGDQAKEMEKQQQGYSEEDMREAFMEGHNIYGCVTDSIDEAKECFNEWFEQFKNK